MDARTLAKSTKALILAAGLIAASTVLGARRRRPRMSRTASPRVKTRWLRAATT